MRNGAEKYLPIQLWYNSSIDVNEPTGGMLMTLGFIICLVTLSYLHLRLSFSLSNVNELMSKSIKETVYIMIQLSHEANSSWHVYYNKYLN